MNYIYLLKNIGDIKINQVCELIFIGTPEEINKYKNKKNNPNCFNYEITELGIANIEAKKGIVLLKNKT